MTSGTKRGLWRGLMAALVALSGCGERRGALELTVGGEADALTRAPAPTLLVVERVGEDRTTEELARVALPAADLSLGDRNRSDVAAIRVRALGADGATLVLGETLAVQFGALENTTLPVFVQRVGELARMPGPFDAPIPATVARLVLGRFVLAVDGTTSALYDLLSLSPRAAPALTRPARSVLTIQSTVISIDEAGATSFDLSTGVTNEIQAPTGGEWAEIAGGATVVARDGTQYVVGGTRRTGGATARVLRVDPAGVTTFRSFAGAREGACAAWVEGRGLVVVGGSATAAGAEVLGPDATAGAPLAFPPDATTDCAATTVSASEVLVVGGAPAAAPRVIDVACATSCAPAAWPGLLDLRGPSAVSFEGGSALVAGETNGATHVHRVTREAPPVEIAVRAPRSGGRLVAVPTGAAALVGGAREIEQYVP